MDNEANSIDEHNFLALISKYLKVPKNNAKEYCEAVQELFFNPKPSARLIAYALVNSKLVNPKPGQVAKIIAGYLQKEHLVKVYKQNHPDLFPENIVVPSSDASKSSSSENDNISNLLNHAEANAENKANHIQIKPKITRSIRNDVPVSFKPSPSSICSHGFYSALCKICNENPYSECCPHGVNRFSICPLCDPEGYKFWHGED